MKDATSAYSAIADAASSDTASDDTSSADTVTSNNAADDTAASEPPQNPLKGGREFGQEQTNNFSKMVSTMVQFFRGYPHHDKINFHRIGPSHSSPTRK